MFEFKEKTKTEEITNKEIKKKDRLLGNLQLKRGQKLWKVHLDTFDVSEAEFHRNHAVLGTEGKVKIKKEVIIDEDYTYVPAINAKNALRKVLKRFAKH